MLPTYEEDDETSGDEDAPSMTAPAPSDDEPVPSPDLLFRALRSGATLHEISRLFGTEEAEVDAEDGEMGSGSGSGTEARGGGTDVMTKPPVAPVPMDEPLQTIHGEIIENCSECGSYDVVFEHGFLHCRDCDHCETIAAFDWGYDYRSFPEGKDTSRCMAPRVKLQNSQLMITGNGRSMLERIHRSYGSTYHEKTLDGMCKTLINVAQRANIKTRVIDQACGYAHQIFKKDSDGSDLRGGNREGLLGACLYFALQHNADKRNTEEVAEIMGIKSKYVNRGIAAFANILECVESVTQFYDHKPEIFVKRWVSELVFSNPKMHRTFPERFDENFAKKLADRVIACLKNLERFQFNNKPETLTAGCLWWILSHNAPQSVSGITGITREDIAKICHVSESTIQYMSKQIARAFVIT